MFYSMNQLFDNLINEAATQANVSKSSTNQPLVNLYQKEDKVLLMAELPGLKTEDVELQVKDKFVTIKGEHKLSYEKELKAIHSERATIQFERKFKLPFQIDHSKTTAELKDGVLLATLERAEADKPYKVEIQ